MIFIDFYIQLLRGVDQYFEVLKPLARPDMVLPGRLRRLLWKICHAQTPRTSLASKGSSQGLSAWTRAQIENNVYVG